MGKQPIEEFEVFRLFEEVADWSWEQVSKWSQFAQDTIGKQMVRAVDSINANLVEGDGRQSDKEGVHFFVIARGSAREARLWIRRAIKRRLCDIDAGEDAICKLTSGTRLLNNLIAYRRGQAGGGEVHETKALYMIKPEDPYAIED